jgi:hypothetical protein
MNDEGLTITVVAKPVPIYVEACNIDIYRERWTDVIELPDHSEYHNDSNIEPAEETSHRNIHVNEYEDVPVTSSHIPPDIHRYLNSGNPRELIRNRMYRCAIIYMLMVLGFSLFFIMVVLYFITLPSVK